MLSYTISEPCALNRDFRQWTGEESALCPIVTRIRQILRDVSAEINIKVLHRLEKYVFGRNHHQTSPSFSFYVRSYALEVAPKPVDGKEAGKKWSYSNTTCISPLWKDTTTNNVVTLRMPFPQTEFTSFDTFMAAHSPRRFCQARQKYILSKYSMQLSLVLCFLPANSLKHCIDFNTKYVYAAYTTKRLYSLFVSLKSH